MTNTYLISELGPDGKVIVRKCPKCRKIMRSEKYLIRHKINCKRKYLKGDGKDY